ncbi:hypothetical protein B0T17DRAFT_621213 [Bombardia bombarda]|uniref:NAD(P)-binding domain-containing protein n=1 Tax=Bombardia bombarda TaxID=252184 RepID=A0AA39WAC1_9PEZI|nr:hypothetical protein B0T17DRAFT_621213 [Bombardia bombarda]
MSKTHVLVFGGTGPAGINLLRELLHRNHPTIAYVRNRSKIPEDLAANSLLEIIEAPLTSLPALSAALARTTSIVSLLGPQLNTPSTPSPIPAFYTSLFALMRQHSVKRILASTTVSVVDTSLDGWSPVRALMIAAIRLISPPSYRTVLDIAKVFETDAAGLDWTVYRVAMIPGGSDEKSWREDRERGGVYEN